MGIQLNSLAKITPSGGVSLTNSLFQPSALTGACASLVLAIWNNRNESVQKELDKCINVDKKFTDFKLTPFHLAALKENGAAMEALLKAGANIDAKDWKGYTALHHLALKGNTKAVSLLIKRGADPKIRNDLGGTYADLLRFNAPFRKDDFPLDRTLFSAQLKDPVVMQDTCIPKDAKTVGEMAARPEALFESWYEKPQKSDLWGIHKYAQLVYRDKYPEFKRNPPALEVLPVQVANKPRGTFCGLFAKDLIKKGDIIAEYTGEMITEEARENLENVDYLEADFPAIDSRVFRSAASMANDGFPNSSALPVGFSYLDVQGVDGISQRRFLVALEDIQPGEQITQNYGSQHPLKNTYSRFEFRLDAIREFFKEKDAWKKMMDSFPALTSQTISGEGYFEVMGLVEKGMYLFDTQPTLAWMIDEGLITRKDLNLFRKTAKNSEIAARIMRKGVLDHFIEPVLKMKEKDL